MSKSPHSISTQPTTTQIHSNPRATRRPLKASTQQTPNPFGVDAAEVYWPHNLIRKTLNQTRPTGLTGEQSLAEKVLRRINVLRVSPTVFYREQWSKHL